MSKVMLITDKPNACIDCPVHFADDRMVWCGKEKKEILAEDFETFKPDWCPLKDVPEKMKVCGKYPQPDGIVPSYKIGFNACIDEILKESD